MTERGTADDPPPGSMKIESLAHLREIGTRLVDDFRAAALVMLDEQKHAAAREVDGVAAVLRRSTPPIERAAGSVVAGYADDAATRLGGVAGSLRQRRLGEIADDVAAFARRQPGVFIAAAVIGGIAAGRLLAASNQRGEGAIPPVTDIGRRVAPPADGGHTAGAGSGTLTEPVDGG